jgi:hypothetical protein
MQAGFALCGLVVACGSEARTRPTGLAVLALLGSILLRRRRLATRG